MILQDACIMLLDKKYRLICAVCWSSYDKTLSDACASLADKWSKSDDTDLSQFKPSDLEQFSAYQKKAFLSILLQHVSFTATSYCSVISLMSCFR